MDKNLLPIRIVFVVLCAAAGWLVCYTITDWDRYRGVALTVGLCIGLLVVLVDIMLKGFSLRALSAVTFGIAIGVLLAHMVGTSPLFAYAKDFDEKKVYLA